MTGRALTPKQEAFCHAYIETGNASEAYRRAYNAKNMQPDTIWVKACELLKNGKVTVRVAELTAQVAEKLEVTVESIAAQLDEDRQLAFREGQSGAAVSATMGKAKLFGLIVEKRADVTQLTLEQVDAELNKLFAAAVEAEGAGADEAPEAHTRH